MRGCTLSQVRLIEFRRAGERQLGLRAYRPRSGGEPSERRRQGGQALFGVD
jgi:hypothetical protein